MGDWRGEQQDMLLQRSISGDMLLSGGVGMDNEYIQKLCQSALTIYNRKNNKKLLLL